jgi:hypothetical protein
VTDWRASWNRWASARAELSRTSLWARTKRKKVDHDLVEATLIMAITCPKCGAEFDSTLFEFGNRVHCDCGAEVEYPGTGLRAGHVAAHSAPTTIRSPPPQKDHLLQAALAAATQLVADLDLACKHPEQWKNESLADMLVEEALPNTPRRQNRCATRLERRIGGRGAVESMLARS